MNKNHKNEIEELLSELVDDQASDRRKTEFKRLAKHDPSLVDQFAAMQRQKEILNAMPVESAPDALVDDVRSALERKMILGDVAGAERTIAGAGHLLMRRILTTAAMLLLPLGLLSLVLWEIVKPPAGSGGYVSTKRTLAQNGSGDSALTPAIVKELPFDGVLTFRTDQQMNVSNYVWKMVTDQGLVNLTVPNRTAEVMSYQIVAPPEKIALLIDAIEGVWPYCQQASLCVVNGSPEGETVEIKGIQANQVKMLAAEDSRDMYHVLARQYASANQNRERAFAKGDTPTPAPLMGENPPLTMPILTGKSDPVPETVDPSQPTVRLQIRIEHTVESTPQK